MVGGSGSPHELIIVLEPEAASVYCFKRTLDLGETKGDQFLVVDVGGGECPPGSAKNLRVCLSNLRSIAIFPYRLTGHRD